MALRLKVLSKKVQKFERRGLESYALNKERLPAFDAILDGVFTTSCPLPEEYQARRELIRTFNDIGRYVFAESGDVPTVVEFGSFVMDLFTSKSDLDLSFNFNNAEITREKKIQAIRKLAKLFYILQNCGHVHGVFPVTTAKVPILKVVDRGTGVECDLSVENRDGVLKSKLIQLICSIDERFRKLSFLMKLWAKALKINSSKDGTLNSLSIILLVAFHLQTRSPPILPPFGALLKDGADPASVARLLSNFANFGIGNQESVAQLFLSLLIKLASVEKLWPKGLCASVYEGSWTSKTWESKVATMSVEDFTDRSQNVARAVTSVEFKVIYRCIQQSIRCISAFLDGKIEGYRLQELLFGKAPKPPVGAPVTNLPERGHDGPNGAKKARYTSNGSTGDNWLQQIELEKAKWGARVTNTNKNWGGTQDVQYTNSWLQRTELEKSQWGTGRTKTKKNWGGTQDRGGPNGLPPAKKARYTSDGSTGETSSDNWVEQIELEKAQRGTSLTNKNWGGTQCSGGWVGR